MIGNKKEFNNDRVKAGFSLIELIVSLSIIALISGIFLVNYHNTNRRTDLTMAAQTLVTDIRYAQANALGLIKYDGEVPAGGWGIFVSTNPQDQGHYLLFADENDNQKFDAGEASTNLGGRRIDLPANIVIDNLSPLSPTANITFLPPDPITRLSSDTTNSTYLDIRLKEKVNNNTKTIRVNFLGLVEVID